MGNHHRDQVVSGIIFLHFYIQLDNNQGINHLCHLPISFSLFSRNDRLPDNLVYFCVLDKDKLNERTGVAAQVVSITIGRKYESVFTVFIALSTLACLNGGIATGSRWLFATARNRQMPSFMAKLGKRTSSPYAAALMQVSGSSSFLSLFVLGS